MRYRVMLPGLKMQIWPRLIFSRVDAHPRIAWRGVGAPTIGGFVDWREFLISSKV
jgi:hypothetical protein